jgi:hypothetical protein
MDDCGKCTFRYQKEKNKKKGAAEDDSNNDIDKHSDAESDEPKDCEAKEKKMSDIAESFLSGNCVEEEAIIQEASFHVDQAKFAREIAQK